MSDLLAAAVDAHGGLDRWNQLRTGQTDFVILGEIFDIAGQSDLFRQVTVTANLHEEYVELDPASFDGRHTVFDGRCLVMEDVSGHALETWEDPPTRFTEHTSSSWTRMHAAYFCSEALWTQMTMPFLLTDPGVDVEEIEPWFEGGELWRSLRVRFPERTGTRCDVQIAHFGPDGLLRRRDHVMNLFRGTACATYAQRYRNVDGIMIPTRWVAHTRAPGPAMSTVQPWSRWTSST